jgi:hypothetical protein
MPLGSTSPFATPMKSMGPNRAIGASKPEAIKAAMAAMLARDSSVPAKIIRFGPIVAAMRPVVKLPRASDWNFDSGLLCEVEL